MKAGQGASHVGTAALAVHGGQLARSQPSPPRFALGDADLAAHADRVKAGLAQVLRGDRAAAARLWRRVRTALKTSWGAEMKGA